MIESSNYDNYTVLNCAFAKFFRHRYPVLAKTHVYTSSHYSCMHCHDFPQIWYCLRGKYYHIVDNQVYECTKGSIVLIPIGVSHRFWILENEETELIHLNVMYDISFDLEQHMNAVANLFLPVFGAELRHRFPVYMMLSKERQSAVEHLFSWFLSLNANSHNPIADIEIQNKLEELFSLPEFALPPEKHKKATDVFLAWLPPFIKVVSYLNAHYNERIVEADLINLAFLCKTDLCKYFKRLIRHSCFTYLRWIRIGRAALYMTHTAYSAAYISNICYFSNPSHMSRIFTKYTGESPGVFRDGRKAWMKRNQVKRSINLDINV